MLASACLAAIARGFTRPLAEITRKSYAAYWEGVADIPQRMLDDGENPEFHSLLQRLKATTQHLDIHIVTDLTYDTYLFLLFIDCHVQRLPTVSVMSTDDEPGSLKRTR